MREIRALLNISQINCKDGVVRFQDCFGFIGEDFGLVLVREVETVALENKK